MSLIIYHYKDESNYHCPLIALQLILSLLEENTGNPRIYILEFSHTDCVEEPPSSDADDQDFIPDDHKELQSTDW